VIISTGIALSESWLVPVSKKKKYNDKPFGYHQEFELTVATLTNHGIGLGRVEIEGGDAARKWVVMVAFALPGERVRVRVFRNHANYSEADLVEVLEASPHRIEPKCPLFRPLRRMPVPEPWL
jgi:tRNA/tmRNA/rRNA uracil-C5-methylase (TrmA/RlmC/RlmD family)